MKKAAWLIILLAGLLQASGFTQTSHRSKKPVTSSQSGKKKKAVRKKAAVKKTVPKKPVVRAKARKTARVEYGTASFYNNKFVGKKTASGELFSQKKLTAAHNSVPMGTLLRVTSMKTKKSVIVRVIDRMHVRNKRIVDLTKAAAQKLGDSGRGLLKVKVEVLSQKK